MGKIKLNLSLHVTGTTIGFAEPNISVNGSPVDVEKWKKDPSIIQALSGLVGAIFAKWLTGDNDLPTSMEIEIDGEDIDNLTVCVTVGGKTVLQSTLFPLASVIERVVSSHML